MPSGEKLGAATDELRGAVEELLPEPGRSEAADFIAESIVEAASIANQRWALTLTEQGKSARLNVGKPQVIHLKGGLVHIEVNEGLAPTDLVEHLEAEGRTWRWMKQPPRSLCLGLTPAEIAEWGAKLRPAHNAVIKATALSTSSQSPYREAHSPAFLGYIESAVGRELPAPAYGSGEDKWVQAISLCLELLSDREAFDDKERNYKLEVAERVRRVVAADTDGEFEDALIAALRSPNNLISWQVADEFRKFVRAEPADAHAATRVLTGEGSVAERINRFNELLPDSVRQATGARLSIASLFLMGCRPAEFPMFRPDPFTTVERTLGWNLDPSSESIGSIYEAHVAFASELRGRVGEAFGETIDMLDAQSLIFVLAKYSDPRFKAWRGEEIVDDALAEAVAEFREATGYPTAWDQERIERRETFEAYLAPESLPTLQRDQLISILNDRKYGYMHFGGHAAKRTIEAADDAGWTHIIDTIDELAHSNDPLADRIDRFCNSGLSGFKESVATKLLAIAEHERVLPIFVVHGPKGKEALMSASVLALESPAGETVGSLAAGSNEALFERLEPFFASDTWGMSRLLYHLSPDDEDSEQEEQDSLANLNDSLHLAAGFLESCKGLIEHKRQLIFYGPPGTGKTYIARAFGRFFASDSESFEIVQFHPSYSYEDFVQGYRPVPSEEGGLGYELLPGPLLQLAKQASENPDRTFVLLIDEINRGNLPRIFGELLFALEYRDEKVRLMYGRGEDATLTLPPNLLIIAAMNTADRSIGLIDAALRRRFHFKALFPAKEPIKDSLRLWLSQKVPEMEQVADLVDRLNARLRERLGEHLQVGHSYFMREDLSEDLLEEVWDADIMPFLEDQLFGEAEQLKEFTLEALRSEGTEASAALESEVSHEDGGTGGVGAQAASPDDL